MLRSGQKWSQYPSISLSPSSQVLWWKPWGFETWAYPSLEDANPLTSQMVGPRAGLPDMGKFTQPMPMLCKKSSAALVSSWDGLPLEPKGNKGLECWWCWSVLELPGSTEQAHVNFGEDKPKIRSASNTKRACCNRLRRRHVRTEFSLLTRILHHKTMQEWGMKYKPEVELGGS